MQAINTPTKLSNPTHAWLKTIEVAFAAGPMSPMLQEFTQGLLSRFQDLGHKVVETPTNETKVLFTTAPFGEAIPWREALFSQRGASSGFSTLPFCTP